MATTVYCLAPGCKNNSKVTEGIDPPVYYHRIRDDSRWYRFCCLPKRDRFAQTVCERPELALCSAHFDPVYYKDGQTLPEYACPTIPTPLEETSKMCYVCLNPESVCTLVPIEEEIQSELSSINLKFTKAINVPAHLCTQCNGEVTQMLNYCDRVRGANNFWNKFGINIGVVQSIVNTTTKDNFVPNNNETECSKCNYRTSGNDSLFNHFWKNHVVNLSEPHICGVCNKVLANERSNRKHYLTHHYEKIQDENSVCVYCGFVAKTHTHLTFHLKNSHDIMGKQFLCEWCTNAFDSQENFDAHMEYRHPERLINGTNSGNNETEIIIDAMLPVTKQEKINEGNDNFFDDDIYSQNDNDDRNSPWLDEDDLSLNVKSAAPPKSKKNESLLVEPKAQPPKSTKKKIYKQRLRPGKDPYVVKKCPACNVEISGKETMAVGGLYRHFWVRHGRNPETPNICKECKKTFTSEHACRIHLFKHHFEKNYSCEVCGKADMTKHQLASHKKVGCKFRKNKEVKKNFIVCRFCNRKYVSIEKMMEHEKEHENDGIDRPFVCNECGKCFTKAPTLEMHVKQHAGIYPYNCSDCDMKFTTSSGLRVHSYQHSGYSPFRCSLCDKEFKQLSLIRGHILRNHGSYDDEILNKEIIIRKDDCGIGKRGRRKRTVVDDQVTNSNNSYDDGSFNSL